MFSSSGYPQPQFDIPQLVTKLEEYKDINVFLADCDKYGIKNDGKRSNLADLDKNLQALKEQLYALQWQYESYGLESYNKLREKRIKEFSGWKEGVDDDKKEELRENGLICPECDSEMVEKYTGLLEVLRTWATGGNVGAGVHISGEGKKEFQFHYKKCKNCDHWEMIEYRETPSWWDDLWGIDKPFTKGDIIQEYINGNRNGERYKSHEIVRW